MTKNEFINKIAPIIQKENEKRNNPLFNSVVIAQAILETGWGKSERMIKSNALFGIKANKNWKGKVYNSKTKECYDNKTFTIISSNFRAYNSFEESIKDYFDLICNSERYKNALNCVSYYQCIVEIKNGGYATDPLYVASISSIILSNNLQKYDNFERKEKTIVYIKNKVYKTRVDLRIRKEPTIYSETKKYKDVTLNAKLHCKYKNKNDIAVLKAGTKITCKDVIYENKNIWIKIPSGFVCSKEGVNIYVN